MKLRAIEIVEDRTAESRCDEGFLKVSRLQLRNRYEDGSVSEVYPCDVVSRPGGDAVVAVVYERCGRAGIRVVLREGPRAPIYLRRFGKYVHPDSRPYDLLLELAAGLVEEGDGGGDKGLRRRAAVEAKEEVGLSIPPERFTLLGGESFASPGTSDEKLFFCAAPARIEDAQSARGDGSVMEEASQLVAMELGEAIARCRSGDIPDMKTELGLLRLADHLEYIPQLGCFVKDLPEEVRRRYRSLGIQGACETGRRR
jgi:ADP-ribose pyrophosphatase